jgi:cyclophilin family peptidyl-prolyl cis-trans isomerase
VIKDEVIPKNWWDSWTDFNLQRVRERAIIRFRAADGSSIKEVPMRRYFTALTGLVLAFFAVAMATAQTTPASPILITMKTSKGDINLELYPEKAPITVKNFIAYMDAKFYDGTIFHRVIKGFMIQGGGLTADLTEKPAWAPIKNESGNGLKNARGAIAMARSDALDSATCQFYINHVDNFALDRDKYAVFGKVVSGMDVVDAIAAVPTATLKGNGDVPRETIAILSVRPSGKI